MKVDNDLVLETIKSGTPAEQYNLGRKLELGDGVDKDLSLAAFLYIKSAEAKDSKAKRIFGFDYLHYRKLNVNTDRFEIIVNAAEAGYAQAQYNLGGRYARGLNIPKDYALAMHWFVKAMEQGHLEAQLHLGLLYRDGLGVDKDLEKADTLIRDAASKGCAEAQYELGKECESGSEDGGDPKKAFRWYLVSAQNCYPLAMYRLGEMYRDGIGVKHSSKSAIFWFMKSRGHCRIAWYKIGQMYEAGYDDLKQNFEKAIGCYRAAGKMGYTKGYYRLAEMYEHGIYFERNMSKAIEMYRYSANGKYAPAKLRLMELHIEGIWLKRDEAKIRRYWNQIKDVPDMKLPEGFAFTDESE